MRKEWFLLPLLLILPLTSSALELNRIVAVINNDAVTSLQLEKAMAAGSGTVAIDERSQALERLIEESLIRQRAEEIGLTVSNDEIEAAVQDVLRQNKLEQEQLDKALAQQGMTIDDYRQGLRRQILRFKLIGREVQGLTEVSSREIQDDYQANSSLYQEEATVELKHISFPLAKKSLTEQTEQTIKALMELRAKQDFATVLAAAEAKGATGGDMGKVKIEDLNPDFVTAIKDLPIGEISDLVNSDQSLHLLIVTSRTPGGIRPLEEVRDAIRSKLVEKKRLTAVKDWLEGLKKKAHIDVRL